jgi:hypothetical protein
MLPDHFVSGEILDGSSDGQVTYTLGDKVTSAGLWKFDLPEGILATAFVAKDGNEWGLASGTVAVWFFTDESKGGGVQILNPDNPLRIIWDADNTGRLDWDGSVLTLTITPQSGDPDVQTVDLNPLPSEFLAQFSGSEFSVVGGGLVYTAPGGEQTIVPGEFADGFHVTLDSGRVVDIPQESLGTMFQVDAEHDLLKIYDTSGVLSAEYDYYQNTWVDLEKLASEIKCSQGCFNIERGAPAGMIAVESNSTGIFRTVDLQDKSGVTIGNLLVVQMVTRTPDNQPAVYWEVLQGEFDSNPGVNILVGIFQGIFNEPSDLSNTRLPSVDEWKSKIGKGLKWELGFSNSGDPFYTVLKNTYLDLPENEAKVAAFIAGQGKVSFDTANLILVTQMLSDR